MSQNDLIDPSIKELLNSIKKHIQYRTKIIAGLFVLGLAVGVPLSKSLVNWLLNYGLLPSDVNIIVLSPVEFIMIQFRAGAWLGLSIVILTLLVEAAWKSGLKQKIPSPGKSVIMSMASMAILTIAGLWYSWEILTPLILEYLASDAQEAGLSTEWRLNSFVGFIINLCIACVIGFQAPVATIIALRSKIISRFVLINYRRHIWFATCVLAAIFSPPDILSLFLVACPIIFLFEIALAWDYLMAKKEDVSV